jgi:hypothetical protein
MECAYYINEGLVVYILKKCENKNISKKYNHASSNEL